MALVNSHFIKMRKSVTSHLVLNNLRTKGSGFYRSSVASGVTASIEFDLNIERS